ncbi:MAG: shikimate kinase [Clostridia bacterium]|nr:shikimate kinase [Clostridia bacterium]
MKNVVLIGMPGSGKSSVGELVAKGLDRPFADTDAMVEEAEDRAISEIFAADGEAFFRDRESAAVLRAAAMDGAVIATGGGVILREQNMDALRKTGVIFFLDRPPEVLAGLDHGGRPLLAGDAERIFALYGQRIGLYRKYADHSISNPATAEEAAEQTIKLMEAEGEA